MILYPFLEMVQKSVIIEERVTHSITFHPSFLPIDHEWNRALGLLTRQLITNDTAGVQSDLLTGRDKFCS